jgi:biotin carboxyl carrier protein
MKLEIKLRAGSQTSEHRLEILPPADAEPRQNAVRFDLDGKVAEALAEEISPGVYSILLEGRSYEAVVAKPPGDPSRVESPFVVNVGLRRYSVEIRNPRRWRRGSSRIETEGPQEIVAPMPGKIVKILVQENQAVARDQGLLVIEAMKMQNELRAPRSGRVEQIYVGEGLGVETGAQLLRLA